MKFVTIKKSNITEHNTKGAYNSYCYLANSIRFDESKCIAKSEEYLNEDIDWEIDRENEGGVIVFSTDVNAVKLDDNAVMNWIKQKWATITNRLGYNSKLDKIAKKHEGVYAWTIGKYLHGRYKAKNNKVFDENSLSVELLNVDSDTLLSVAEDICRDFNQETVLVKDYANDKIYFVNGD